ncbi:MAG: DnaJ C-terminal domain-containing protein [Acidimicrobiales bacterium]
MVCPACEGSGARPSRVCQACSGRGWWEEARELTVRVPAGVGEGTRLRLRWPSGGAAGFARIRLKEDRWFAREGRDLVLRLPLTVAEAALGARVSAALPDGPVDIVVPAGTPSGTRIRIHGRGVPGAPPGDLVAVAEVVLPLDPGDAERSALEVLAAVSPNPRHHWPAASPGAGSSTQTDQDGEPGRPSDDEERRL